MCQRFVLPDQVAAEREFLPDVAWWNFTPRFNVAPTQYVAAVRMYQGQAEGVMMRWGLIPSRLDEPPEGPPNVTVNGDQVDASPVYRAPWLEGRRCIVPMSGFYLWQLMPERHRQPYFVRLADRGVFGVAALWDRWVSKEDDVIEGCSLICVPPNDLVCQLTGQARAMPAILRRRDYQTWLRGTPAEAAAALHTYHSTWMQAHPVSPRVNSTSADDPDLIRLAS